MKRGKKQQFHERGQLTSLDKDLHDDRCLRYVVDVWLMAKELGNECERLLDVILDGICGGR